MKAISKYVSKKPDYRGLVSYNEIENNTWQTLIQQQLEIVKTRACDEYLSGLQLLNFPLNRIPQIPDVNQCLQKTTGWSVEPVSTLIGFDRFFKLLSERKFPCATFIRTPDELKYLQGRDIFNELFGHCPMLTHSVYADFMQRYGELGVGQPHDIQRLLARFYWFTVEFGLINTPQGLRCYGGGVLSSIGETVYALEDPCVRYERFDALNILRTPYLIDIYQPVYYVIRSYESIYNVLKDDFIELIKKSQTLPEFKALYLQKERLAADLELEAVK
ncbi:phenylalanine 4-monooxygenase [Caedibacter taeniospiralis]|uniref:phenylalanine 4-monooxygenase n=1 Tax=Caedibacter taeniospiralis TaxID=28907 RepID=UPI000C27CB84|nr:phenylalanine 4-monooxygenase [Caedibacter taeniospiralis]